MTDNDDIRIAEIAGNRHDYMPLLLVGDESEAMIASYLDRGALYVGFSGSEAVAVCLAADVDANTVEVKNLAVATRWRRRGLGRRMLEHVEMLSRGRTVILGTGETPSTLRFYESCGYVYSHRVPDFFTANYPEPIIEEGVTLRDMIYLKKEIRQ